MIAQQQTKRMEKSRFVKSIDEELIVERLGVIVVRELLKECCICVVKFFCSDFRWSEVRNRGLDYIVWLFRFSEILSTRPTILIMERAIGTCSVCGKPSKKICSKCKREPYCSRECMFYQYSVQFPFNQSFLSNERELHNSLNDDLCESSNYPVGLINSQLVSFWMCYK